MVFAKSTVHVSRLAGTALKTFTHGYAQTVVAATQSSYASQNTPVAPLASRLLGSDTAPGKQRNQHGLHHVSQTTTISASGIGQSSDHHPSTLIQLKEAWKKHHPSVIADNAFYQQASSKSWKSKIAITEDHEVAAKKTRRDSSSTQSEHKPNNVHLLRRSYSTSAIENHTGGMLTEESTGSHQSKVNVNAHVAENETSDDAAQLSAAINSTSIDPQDEVGHKNSIRKVYETELQALLTTGDYARIPEAFQAMVRSGIEQPSQEAYQALLSAAIKLGDNKQHVTSRIFDICLDMSQRHIRPDLKTTTILLETLAGRAVEVAQELKVSSKRRHRLGSNANLFRLDTLDNKLYSEDHSLDLALHLFSISGVEILPDTRNMLILACAVANGVERIPAMLQEGQVMTSEVYLALIRAYGNANDLRQATTTYDRYRALSIVTSAGQHDMKRLDTQIYAALVLAHARCGELERGKRFLSRIELAEVDINDEMKSREHVLLNGILPAELHASNFDAVHALVNTLSAPNYMKALEKIAIYSADTANIDESVKAYKALAAIGGDPIPSAQAIYALFLRSGHVPSSTYAEEYWSTLEKTTITPDILQLGVIRTLNHLQTASACTAMQSFHNILSRFSTASLDNGKNSDLLTEAVEIVVNGLSSNMPNDFSVESSAAALRMMMEFDILLIPQLQNMLAVLSPNNIAYMSSSDLEVFLMAQAQIIFANQGRNDAGPARFACMLESFISRSYSPSISSQVAIDQVLSLSNQSELSQLWSAHKYSFSIKSHTTPPSTSQSSRQSLTQISPTISALDAEGSFDPYHVSTDHKGSIAITELLESNNKSTSSILDEAVSKLQKIRNAGLHPRYFAYQKLIQTAAKEEKLDTAMEILSMAHLDMPFTPEFRVVRYGWTSMLDAMVAACIAAGRRDLAEQYHQELLSQSSAPSANTYGLYITTMKETTKTFDEATEALKIFLRSKSEGVEPTSFLYNALIGKLGKARRIDDCLFHFAEMRKLGIKPTSVTYGTIVNALCRVSDGKFAEEMFREMESCANYKARPAPYHSLMQYFLTKQDRNKVLEYYSRMKSQHITPTLHTFKLLIDAFASISPLDMSSAENVLSQMVDMGLQPEAVHYASLIHAKGCVANDLEGARKQFKQVLAAKSIRLQSCIYQAMFETLVAHHRVNECEDILTDMLHRKVQYTPYIANALIHGWTIEKDLVRAQEAFNMVHKSMREPSTYEAMVKAHLAVTDFIGAQAVVDEASKRGYPAAVLSKITHLMSSTG